MIWFLWSYTQHLIIMLRSEYIIDTFDLNDYAKLLNN